MGELAREPVRHHAAVRAADKVDAFWVRDALLDERVEHRPEKPNVFCGAREVAHDESVLRADIPPALAGGIRDDESLAVRQRREVHLVVHLQAGVRRPAVEGENQWSGLSPHALWYVDEILTLRVANFQRAPFEIGGQGQFHRGVLCLALTEGVLQ